MLLLFICSYTLFDVSLIIVDFKEGNFYHQDKALSAAWHSMRAIRHGIECFEAHACVVRRHRNECGGARHCVAKHIVVWCKTQHTFREGVQRHTWECSLSRKVSHYVCYVTHGGV